MQNHFTVKFEADGILYEAQVWPEEDENENCYCQVTYCISGQPENSTVIYLESKDNTWIQKIEEDGEKMASGAFISELGKQINNKLLL